MRYFLFIIVFVAFSSGQVVAAPTAEAFGTLPTVYDAAISPDGKQIAIIVNIRGQYGVRVVTLGKKDEKLRAILLGEGVKPRWIKWANDKRVLVSLWESKKYRTTPYTVSFIFTLDASSMKGKILIESDEIFRQDNADVVDFLEDDPDHILMAFSDDNQFLSDVNRVNVKTGRYVRIERAKKHVQRWYTDARGEPRVGQGLVDRTRGNEEEWNLTIRDADEDRWHKADEFPGLEANVRIFGFTEDPNELVIGDRAGRDTLGIYVYDLVDKEISRKLFHHDTYDAGGLVVSGNGAIIGARFVADTTEIRVVRAIRHGTQPSAQSDSATIRWISSIIQVMGGTFFSKSPTRMIRVPWQLSTRAQMKSLCWPLHSSRVAFRGNGPGVQRYVSGA